MKYALLILFLIPLISCNVDIMDVTIPTWDTNSTLENTSPLSPATKELAEGIYHVSVGKKLLGEKVVLKWNSESLSVYSGKNAVYCLLGSGQKDSTLYFEGYWRSATGSESGLLQFQISKSNGGAELLKNIRPQTITLTGFYGNNKATPSHKIAMDFSEPLKKPATDFYIIGHRGGGRNIDRLPYSENSLGMLKFSEKLGVNAVEIDIQQTKDGELVLFHDQYLSKRLINEDYFIGKISDYTFAQLRTFCTLIDGEKIPTLDEALSTLSEETRIKLVWLDIKDANLIPILVSIQQKYSVLAPDLEILIGIPDKKVLEKFIQTEHYQNIPSLCELKVEDVLFTNSRVWAPRWSAGISDEEVRQIHSVGKRAFTWTLDDQVIIKTFLKKGNFDGFVTNYPALLTYEYYTTK